MEIIETYFKERTKEEIIQDWEKFTGRNPGLSFDDVFSKVNFPLLEVQRTALSFVVAGADKETRSQSLEIGLKHLDGLQNFLDYLTDVCCDVYGEEKVLPMMTKMLEEGSIGAKIIPHPASVDHKNKK